MIEVYDFINAVIRFGCAYVVIVAVGTYILERVK